MTVVPRAVFGALIAGLFGLSVTQAQPYPNRYVTLIVPFAAGGTTDAIARVLAEHMSGTLGQQVVIENIGGAGGTIASARVARSAPDGYTLLIHQLGLAAGVTLFPKAQLNPEKDLVGVGLVNAGPSVIVGSTAVPAKLEELTAWMKQPGRRAKVSHAGAGSFGHLCAVLFAQAVGAEVDYVPYRGGGPALADVVAGHVDINCGSLIIAAELIKSGRINGVGVTLREEAQALPGVPSLVKLGFKDLDIPFWHAVFAPAGTPRPIVDKLNGALRVAIADPKVIKTFADYGVYAYPEAEQTPEAAGALLSREIKRWADVIRTNKIEAAP